MIYRLLKNNHPANYLLLFFLAILLWAINFYFLSIDTKTIIHQPFSLIDIHIPETYFWTIFSFFIAFAIILLTAFLINSINEKIVIIESVYQLPGFVFIIFSGILFEMQKISPELIANIFVLFSIFRIFSIYKKTNAFSGLYDSGLFISIASLFYIDLIALSVVMIIIAIMIKLINIREFIVFVFGVITPYVIYAAISFLIDDISILPEGLKENLFVINSNKYEVDFFIVSLPFFIMVFIAIISVFIVRNFKKFITRRYINALVLLCIIFLLYYLSPYSGANSMIFLFFPTCLLISNLLVNLSKKISLLLIYSFIISVFIIQIIQIA